MEGVTLKRVSTTFWFLSIKKLRHTRRNQLAAACLVVRSDPPGFGRRVRRWKVARHTLSFCCTPSPPPPRREEAALSARHPIGSSLADAVCQAAKRHVDGGLCPEIKQYAVTRRETGRRGGVAVGEVTMTANIKPTKTNTPTSAAGPS